MYYTLEISSSWNFLARVEPSYEGSEPSRAELGHFNFRAETELTILTICMSKNSKFQTHSCLHRKLNWVLPSRRKYPKRPKTELKLKTKLKKNAIGTQSQGAN